MEHKLTLSIGNPILSHSGSKSFDPEVVVVKNDNSGIDILSNDIFILTVRVKTN